MARRYSNRKTPWWVFCALSPFIPAAWFAFSLSSVLDKTDHLVRSDYLPGVETPFLLYLLIGVVLFFVQGSIVFKTINELDTLYFPRAIELIVQWVLVLTLLLMVIGAIIVLFSDSGGVSSGGSSSYYYYYYY
ncbi:MAG: hypothetical protein LBD25_08370 [Coriobacteriales bacterium]|nr:hypothetical protein [Coriobacteriales bacterium]